MKLKVSIQPEDDPKGIVLDFDVPLSDKQVNIITESKNLIVAVTKAIQNIKHGRRED